MAVTLVLASGSEIRAQLLRQAAVPFEVIPARIDEVALRAGFAAEGLQPRDQADALAEFKTQRVASKHPDRMVLGADQILAHGDTIFGKPDTPDQAVAHLMALSGQTHSLFSAAVIFDEGRPVWRHVAEVRLTMRHVSVDWIEAYVARSWESIQYSVGGYKIEEEGVRLFSRIQGDYFSILGLPLVPLLTYLSDRDVIDP